MTDQVERLKLLSLDELDAMQEDALATLAAIHFARKERAAESAIEEQLPFRSRLAMSVARSFKAAALKNPFRVGLAIVIAMAFVGLRVMELFGVR